MRTHGPRVHEGVLSAPTPGPWIWGEDGNLYPEAAHRRWREAFTAERFDDLAYIEPIAQTDGGAYGPRGADRALIAAAPDLLAACKVALNAFEKNWAIDWSELERAIAKAESDGA